MNRVFVNLYHLEFFVFVVVIGQSTLTSVGDSSAAEVLSQCLILRFSKCYSLFNDKVVTYNSAIKICNQHGGKLASIPDEHTQKFIEKHFVKSDNVDHCMEYFSYNRYCRIWFDLYTLAKYSAAFSTINGATNNYSNWNVGQPDLNSQSSVVSEASFCGALDATDGFWFDDSCHREMNYVLCESEGPSCNIKHIHIPNALFDSCYEDKVVPVNTIIRIKCNREHVRRGNRYVVCRRNGTWSRFPTCKRVCPSPVLSPHSRIYHDYMEAYYNIGVSKVILCDPGYVLETDPTRSHFVITCTDNAVWNIPKCVSITTFQVITQDVNYDEKLNLECDMYNNLLPLRKWLWLKNSKKVPNSAGYTVDATGSLQIDSFKRFHQGIYTCLAMSPRISHGQVAYRLKLPSTCDNVSNSSVDVNVVEDHSLIINCPHDEIKYSGKVFTWIKDGKKLIQSERIFVVPDGSLVITNASYSDNGRYFCDVSWDFGRCTSQFYTGVTVLASAERICGDTLLESSPWTVSLYLEDDKTPFCYGGLIHEKWVITSAYCMSTVSHQKSLKLYVTFGKELLDLEELSGSGKISEPNKIRHVESIKIHPKYTKTLLADDLALLKLKEQVIFTKDIQPVCLTDKDLTKTCYGTDSVQGVVSGWGYFDDNSLDNSKVQTETLTVVLPELCLLTATLSANYSDAIFCATRTTLKVSNAGRFGSPFVVKNKNRIYLLGIFILGERHSHLGDNSYFTKIPNYWSWIRSTIG